MDIFEFIKMKKQHHIERLEQRGEHVSTGFRDYHENYIKRYEFLEKNCVKSEDKEDTYQITYTVEQMMIDNVPITNCAFSALDSVSTSISYPNGELKPYVLSVYTDGNTDYYKIQMYDRETKEKTEDIKVVLDITYNENIGTLDAIDRHFIFNGKKVSNDDVNIVIRGRSCGYMHLKRAIFYDNEKITVSQLYLSRTATRNGLINKTINRRVVFNVETGKSYKLADYDTIAKKTINKKQNPFMCISAFTSTFSRVLLPGLSKEELIEIGEAMQDYIDDPNAIPFKEYVKQALDEHYDENTIRDAAIYYQILVGYNTNPYVPHNSLMNVYKLIYEVVDIRVKEVEIKRGKYKGAFKFEKIVTKNKRYNKWFKPKMLRNKNIEKEYMSYLISNGYSKKYLKYKLNSTSNSFISDDFNTYKTILNLDKVKDINNKYKLVESYFFGKASIYSIKSALNSTLYEELLKTHSETDIINALVKDDNMRLFNDADYFYRDLKRKMPEYKLTVKRLRIKQIHDAISKDYRLINSKSYRFQYSDKMTKDYNTTIDGYKFTLATTCDELNAVGSSMHICVGGYGSKVAEKQCIIVYMMKGNEYVGCLEISPTDNRIEQAKAKYNNRMTVEQLDALDKYLELQKINVSNCYDIPKKYDTIRSNKPIDLEDFVAKERSARLVNGVMEITEVDYIPIAKKRVYQQNRMLNPVPVADIPVFADMEL